MKQRVVTVCMLACIGVLFARGGYGFEKVGTAGFAFLEIPVGARQAAMADAGISLENQGAMGVFWNPASIGYLNGVSVGLNYASWIADISVTGVAIAMPVGNYGTVGLSVMYVGVPDIQGAVADAASATGYQLTDSFSSSGYAVGVSFAHQFTDAFSFGGTVRYIRQEIAEFSSSTFVGDVGTLYYTGLHSLRFATSFQSIGLDQNYVFDDFKMPIRYRIGAAMDFFDAPSSPMLLTVTAEAISQVDYDERLHLGGELWILDTIALRGGYKFNYDEEDFTGGIGLKFSSGTLEIGLDVGYGEFGLFDNVTFVDMHISL